MNLLIINTTVAISAILWGINRMYCPRQYPTALLSFCTACAVFCGFRVWARSGVGRQVQGPSAGGTGIDGNANIMHDGRRAGSVRGALLTARTVLCCEGGPQRGRAGPRGQVVLRCGTVYRQEQGYGQYCMQCNTPHRVSTRRYRHTGALWRGICMAEVLALK